MTPEKAPEKDQRIVMVDSQQLSTMMSCMHNYKYSFIDNYEPHVKEDYFERGELFHRGLQVYYNLKKHKTRWQTNNHDYGKIVNICIKVMRFFAIKMDLDSEEVDENIKHFRDYAEFYQYDGWENILAVEQTGNFVLWQNEDLIILYQVKIDLVTSLPNIPVIPVDHKTGRRRTEPKLSSNQFKGYCVALKTNNLYQNQIGFQKTLPAKERFQRHLLSFDDDILEEWREESAWWIRHSLDLIDRKIFPHNWTSCDKGAGCRFKNVCIKPPVNRLIKLNTDFNHRDVWDVGKEL